MRFLCENIKNAELLYIERRATDIPWRRVEQFPGAFRRASPRIALEPRRLQSMNLGLHTLFLQNNHFNFALPL